MQDKGLILKKVGKVLQFVIPILSISALVYQLNHSPDFSIAQLIIELTTRTTEASNLLILAILLVPINWGIETLKWRMLILKSELITFLKAYKAVLSGVSISILFPFRVGEYLGRISYLKNRVRGSVLTIIGSMTQLISTILIGFISVIYYQYNIEPIEYFYPLLIVITSSLVVALFLLRNSKKLLNQLTWLKKWSKYLSFLNDNHLKILVFKVQLLSVLRYFVFCSQFVLILMAFGLHFSMSTYFLSISLMYLALTAIPINQILELGATRAIIFTALIHLIEGDSTNINILDISLSCSFIWLINIVLPAASGGILLMFKTD